MKVENPRKQVGDLALGYREDGEWVSTPGICFYKIIIFTDTLGYVCRMSI
jgi:hypothetical protein